MSEHTVVKCDGRSREMRRYQEPFEVRITRRKDTILPDVFIQTAIMHKHACSPDCLKKAVDAACEQVML